MLNTTYLRTLEDLINWNDEYADIEFIPGQCCQQVILPPRTVKLTKIFVRALTTTGYDDDKYEAAVADLTRLGATEGIDAALSKYNLDALVLPSEGYVTTPAAIAGYPMVTVPLGTSSENGQPFGLSFIGTVTPHLNVC